LPVEGRAIRIRFLPALTASRDRLYSEHPTGRPVYAAAFVRKREIVMDEELLKQPRELARILTHELFHFAWVRLANRNRVSFEALLLEERRKNARGELGWSAASRKKASRRHRRAWREYLCESFCDTAAWLYSGVSRHPEFTLAPRHRSRRRAWFHAAFPSGIIPI